MVKKTHKQYSNKNSRINTRIDATGKLRTETLRRDDGFDVAITTDKRNNSTVAFIDRQGRNSNAQFASLVFNGREARTLLLTLTKHFNAQNKYV